MTVIDFPAAPAPARPLGLGITRLAPDVLAKVGETFAVQLAALQRALAALGPLAAPQQPVLDGALAAIGRLEELGVRIQELARILDADAPLPVERIALAAAVRETLATWSPAQRTRGVTLREPGVELAVEINAAVLEQLLSLGVDCALRIGPALVVALERLGQPARTILSIQVDRPAQARADEDDGEDFGDLAWTLFGLLARAAGLLPQRLAAGRTVTLMLGFPEADASAAHAVDARAAGLPRTGSTAGRRVLLIEPRESSRIAAHDLMNAAGMHVDTVAGTAQARDSLHDGAPDVVVTGLDSDDAHLAALLDEIRTLQPRLRVIQLVDDDSAFAFSVPGSDNPAQVGRHDMARTLVAAVAQEMDAAWGD